MAFRVRSLVIIERKKFLSGFFCTNMNKEKEAVVEVVETILTN